MTDQLVIVGAITSLLFPLNVWHNPTLCTQIRLGPGSGFLLHRPRTSFCCISIQACRVHSFTLLFVFCICLQCLCLSIHQSVCHFVYIFVKPSVFLSIIELMFKHAWPGTQIHKEMKLWDIYGSDLQFLNRPILIKLYTRDCVRFISGFINGWGIP